MGKNFTCTQWQGVIIKEGEVVWTQHGDGEGIEGVVANLWSADAISHG